MLAFFPLASAPLGADARAALPQVLGQTSVLLAFGGASAARTQIGAQSADLSARLSLGGDASAKAALSGWGAPDLRLGIQAHVGSSTEAGAGLVLIVPGAASVRNTPAARLDAGLLLLPDGRAEAQITGHATAMLDLAGVARCGARIDGRANSLLGLQRSSEADSQIDVTATRSLPLAGSASAVLAGEGTSTSAVSVAITAQGRTGVVPRAVSPIALGGAAKAAGVSSGAAVGQGAVGGLSAMASRASAKIVAGLEITSHARAHALALGQSASLVPCAGLGFAAVIAEGKGALSLPLGLDAEATTGLSAAAGGGVSLSGQSRLGVTISASGRPIQLVLGGIALGTSLEPREARVSGALTLTGQGHAIGALDAKGDGTVVFTKLVTSICTIRAALAGQLSLDRALAAALHVGGETRRAMAFAGAARAAAQTSAGAQDPLLAFASEARARSDAIATGGTDLVLSRVAAASGAVSAAGHLDLDAEILISGRVGAQATLAPALDLRGAALCVAAHRLRAEGPLAWQALASGETAGLGSALDGLGLSGGTVGAMAIRGAASSAFAVTRAFGGDVDVQGDSARHISLGGSVSARTTSRAQTSQSVVEVTGNAGARATAAVEAAANVALPCSAKAGVPAAATTSASIGWLSEAAATAPRSGQCQGMLSLVGTGRARSAARGAAVAGLLVIAGDLGGATGLIAELQVNLALEGTAEAAPSLAAQGTGQFAVARDSDAEVQVAADAARLLPLAGTAAGALVARATRVDGAVALEGSANARAETAACLPTGAILDVQGLATSAARMQAICSGRVAFVRLGQADVLVAAGAAHGMALLGSAQAGNVARATANLPLEPRLSGTATNVIRVEFAAREVGVAARGNAMLGVSGRAVAQDLGLVAAVQALRAPPALRRSEPAKYGLSGRLMPTNSGRILRG